MEKINNKQSKKTENSDKKNIAQLKKSIAVIGWIILFAAVILIFDYLLIYKFL